MWLLVVDMLGCVAALFSCFIAVWIFKKQDKQLLDLRNVGRDTSEIIREIKADSYRQETTNKFFYPGGKPVAHKFKCLLPVDWTGKPLPSIQAGDYHGLHVLQTLLGSQHLDLSFQDTHDQENQDEVKGDGIFLCAPQANPALYKLAPPLTIGPGLSPPSTPRFGNIDLPCWFANETVSEQDCERIRQIKKIWICSKHAGLESLSESEYSACRPNRIHRPMHNIQSDLAILLRLTISKAQRFLVIAGIHQYGTWIAGELLNRLTVKDHTSIRTEHRNILLSKNDFIAIVYGDFCTKTLEVGSLGIHDNLIWTRGERGWEQSQT